MKKQYPLIVVYLKEILNIYFDTISCDFLNTKFNHNIGFMSLIVKGPNVYTHAHIRSEVKIGNINISIGRSSLDTIQKIMHYKCCGINFHVL